MNLTKKETMILMLSHTVHDIIRGKVKAGEAINDVADQIEEMYTGFLCTGEPDNGKCPVQCGDCKYLENDK